LIGPVVPAFPLITLNAPIIAGFISGGVFAPIMCGRLKSLRNAARMIAKDFYDGVVVAAPLSGFSLVVPMFNKASELCAPYFNVPPGSIIPTNPLIVSAAFVLPAPPGLFRCSLTLYGVAGMGIQWLLTGLVCEAERLISLTNGAADIVEGEHLSSRILASRTAWVSLRNDFHSKSCWMI
jgi:hypothetical protein